MPREEEKDEENECWWEGMMQREGKQKQICREKVKKEEKEGQKEEKEKGCSLEWEKWIKV